MTPIPLGGDTMQMAFRPPPSNPFSTRYTKPGALPPLDADGRPVDVEQLLARMRTGCWVIEGPHGRGKSTLLRTLLSRAMADRRAASLVQVRSWADVWPALHAVFRAGPGHIVAVDGWEQLPPAGGLIIVAMARLRRTVVIATAHERIGLPVLVRCESSLALMEAVVARLPDHGDMISTADIEAAFRCHRGNVRDALAALYDRFEERRW